MVSSQCFLKLEVLGMFGSPCDSHEWALDTNATCLYFVGLGLFVAFLQNVYKHVRYRSDQLFTYWFWTRPPKISDISGLVWPVSWIYGSKPIYGAIFSDDPFFCGTFAFYFFLMNWYLCLGERLMDDQAQLMKTPPNQNECPLIHGVSLNFTPKGVGPTIGLSVW